jgi:cytochrome P450
VRSYLATQIKADTFSVFNWINKQLHKAKRRMVGKALSEQKMRQFEPIMLEHVDTFLKQILLSTQTHEAVNMSVRCKRLGVDNIGCSGFGHELNTQTDEENRVAIEGLAGVSYKTNVYI